MDTLHMHMHICMCMHMSSKLILSWALLSCRLATEQGEDWHTPCAANDKAALALLGLS